MNVKKYFFKLKIIEILLIALVFLMLNLVEIGVKYLAIDKSCLRNYLLQQLYRR